MPGRSDKTIGTHTNTPQHTPNGQSSDHVDPWREPLGT